MPPITSWPRNLAPALRLERRCHALAVRFTTFVIDRSGPREEIESPSPAYQADALPLSYRGMEGAVRFELTYRQLRRLVADPIGRTRPNGTPARTRIPISTFVAWCPIL
jgi:hypothetical protein